MLERLFLGSSTKRMERNFAAQFTPDGDGYLFRRGARGPAIRVTTVERDAFVADYMRTWRRLYWSMFGGMFAIVIAIVGLAFAFDIDAKSGLFMVLSYGLIIALIGVFIALLMRAYYEPGRALDHRMTVAGPLTRAESRRAVIARMDWRQIAFAFLLCVGFIVSNWPVGQPHTVGRWLGLAFGVAMLPLLVWNVFRKWRLTRSG